MEGPVAARQNQLLCCNKSSAKAPDEVSLYLCNKLLLWTLMMVNWKSSRTTTSALE